jgi:general nucleoside transport system permease protein
VARAVGSRIEREVVITTLLSGAVIAQTIRMAVPYVCAGTGGVWSERSGVVNIALEGILLGGGLAGVVGHLATGSAGAGILAGAAMGAALGAMHALLVVYGGVDAIVSGLAINLAAAGGSRVVLRALYASSSNSPSIAGFPVVVSGPSDAALLLRTCLDPTTLLAVGLVAWTGWALAQTRLGLRVRASGESPTASASAGVDVKRVRLAAVSIGGAIAGLGGVALAYDQHRFQSGMSGGRGFIALAAVILSGWRPGRAAVACIAFAALDAVQILVQQQTGTAASVAPMLPYLATLFALWIVASRRGAGAGRAPAALGREL